MKKIFLLLNLIAFTAISQVTPVGGYLPLNSSKSFTAGNSTFSNVIARGTLSVGSTATVTGNALFSSSVGIGALPTSSLSSFRMVKGTSTVDIGSPFAGYGGLWVGSSTPNSSNFLVASEGSNPAFNGITTLAFQIGNNTKLLANSGGVNITGSLSASSTMSLGSANLTGGNTGTVAVLSDALFTTTHFHSIASTVDNVTFFFDKSLAGVSITSGVVGRTYLPYNCTLIGYSFESYISGTLGSAGNATVYCRIDNTTDVTLTSVHNYTALTNYNNASNLNTNINAGSYVEIKIIVPDIATAATNVSEYVTLYYVRRS